MTFSIWRVLAPAFSSEISAEWVVASKPIASTSKSVKPVQKEVQNKETNQATEGDRHLEDVVNRVMNAFNNTMTKDNSDITTNNQDNLIDFLDPVDDDNTDITAVDPQENDDLHPEVNLTNHNQLSEFLSDEQDNPNEEEAIEEEVQQHSNKKQEKQVLSTVWSIAADKENKLWLATDNGAYRFNPTTESLKQDIFIPLSITSSDSFIGERVKIVHIYPSKINI